MVIVPKYLVNHLCNCNYRFQLYHSSAQSFYREVGQALSMNNTRSFINTKTLEVEIHAEEDYFSFGDMEDTALEAINNPDQFLAVEQLRPFQSFRVMEAFVETVKDKVLNLLLQQALVGKKPFANFNRLIHNSGARQSWFEFRDEAYAEIAKEWIEENAGHELKGKIKLLPPVFRKK